MSVDIAAVLRDEAKAAQAIAERLTNFQDKTVLQQLAAKLSYWGNRCWLCRGPATQVDHVKPLAKGGPHCLANLRPICGSCNSRKQDTWPWPTP